MNAFVLEKLFSTGWQRAGELFWRRCDAEAAGHLAIGRERARAVRILVATISPDAVSEIEAPPRDKSSRKSRIETILT